jgi:hypothetical protein
MNCSTEILMDAVEKWLVKGDLNPDILASDFTFVSPFWKHADRQSFIDKFLDPTEYIEKSLNNIGLPCISGRKLTFTLYAE